MQLTRKKFFSILGHELDKMNIGDEFEIGHGKVIVELSIIDKKIDMVVAYRQSTKSWDLKDEMKQAQ